MSPPTQLLDAPSLFHKLRQLPYETQEHITKQLTHSDLHQLSITNKSLSVLAARALYGEILLHSQHYPHTGKLNTPRLKEDLRRRQFSFFVAVAHHPEYLDYIRHIAFEFTDTAENGEYPCGAWNQSSYACLIPERLVWNVIGRCGGLVSLEIKWTRIRQMDLPPASKFVNLRHLQITIGQSDGSAVTEFLVSPPFLLWLEGDSRALHTP